MTERPVTCDELDALQTIAATAVLMDPAIAVPLLSQGLKRALAEINRLGGLLTNAQDYCSSWQACGFLRSVPLDTWEEPTPEITSSLTEG